MVVYATREDVQRALDSKLTARNSRQIDRALEGASRDVESLCHRHFYPEQTTRHFDYPNAQRARPWRLWLDSNDLISVTTLSSGGTAIASGEYFLRRSDQRDEPPYSHIEIDLGSPAAFSSGDTHQRAIAITGLWGYGDTETAVGTIAEDLDASETAVDVDGPASALLGVGSVLRVGSERMIVTGRTQLTTGQTLQAALGASKSDETVQVTTGSAYAIDEVLLLDSERMLVVDIAGNDLTVKRTWDGSTLAAHTAPTIYAPRTLTVQRGALGTTAATHTTAATAYRWDPPGPVRNLALAEAINTVGLEQAGYSRAMRSGEGGSERNRDQKGIAALREQVYASHGRKARSRSV